VHPPNSGARDNALLPFAGDEYDTRHNPFIYFHSLLDLGDCSTDDMDLSALPKALRSSSKTAKLSYLAPSLCDDAASAACPGGVAGGLAGEDAFLKIWVPRILASVAYRQNGALMIVFAPSRPDAATAGTATAGTATAGTATAGTTTAGATTAGATATSPTTPSGPTGTSGSAGPTGATGTTSPAFTPVATSASARPMRTGVLIVSPFAKRGRTVTSPYGPYSILRSIEDLFGLTSLGHAKTAASFVSAALPGA
jgi:phosphatidylinositol-3-phosphatase